ncbi:thiol reductase thioredoxin [Phyllobacterium brassicacearum]|uniref:Thiol reductase thioredoxin n=1 Tax=Phyllobacterium brassicacearum TaxID=314235 RepID=A0A2P7B8X6_9HYPH|nr:thioredoxin family protein [Phyllobacterium brassicacearum]PSH62923.1 thiol reductase thioredoxin [Phyllobacterium brassicacearum]TDQ13661.1 thiol-disulfide isomerase/thioredoxin [Phyllobacterium brassicacearum]
MPNRRQVILTAVVFAAGTMFAPASYAASKSGFVQSDFDAAKAAGKSILIEVTAPWCPTCKAQKPILSELTSDKKFKDLVIYEVDFDSQKDVLRRLNVRMQSTLITFKNGKETGRSTGDTNKASISRLLDKAI